MISNVPSMKSSCDRRKEHNHSPSHSPELPKQTYLALQVQEEDSRRHGGEYELVCGFNVEGNRSFCSSGQASNQEQRKSPPFSTKNPQLILLRLTRKRANCVQRDVLWEAMVLNCPFSRRLIILHMCPVGSGGSTGDTPTPNQA